MKRLLAAAVLVVLAACACSVIRYESRQTAGREVYYEGRLSSRIERPLSDVQNATIAAYRHFGIGITKAASDQLSGAVSGTLASGDLAETDLSSAFAGETVVSIKIGPEGDRFISLRILREIMRHLQ
ncbi:MAG: DUF3568 family protein [Nitrospiraceae bacterium]|nr:DUF3568 family protein [Nitrospiraceae bacterium]